jgi:hypothetical protein
VSHPPPILFLPLDPDRSAGIRSLYRNGIGQ